MTEPGDEDDDWITDVIDYAIGSLSPAGGKVAKRVKKKQRIGFMPQPTKKERRRARKRDR